MMLNTTTQEVLAAKEAANADSVELKDKKENITIRNTIWESISEKGDAVRKTRRRTDEMG